MARQKGGTIDTQQVIRAIFGLSLTTFLPRYLPLALLASRPLPRPVIIWLRFVPPAVMVAMLFMWLFAADPAQTPLAVQRLFIAISGPVLIFGLVSRHFFATMVCGCALAAFGRALFIDV